MMDGESRWFDTLGFQSRCRLGSAIPDRAGEHDNSRDHFGLTIPHRRKGKSKNPSKVFDRDHLVCVDIGNTKRVDNLRTHDQSPAARNGRTENKRILSVASTYIPSNPINVCDEPIKVNAVPLFSLAARSSLRPIPADCRF